MVSLGVSKLKAQCGIIITASHNSSEYSGFKLRGDHAGPMFEKDLKDIENLISTEVEIDLELLNWNYLIEQGYINYIDLESIYQKDIRDSFKLQEIASSGLKFAFDAMYGSSQNFMHKMLPDVLNIHCEVNPSFNGIRPDPLRKNLHELIEIVWNRKNIDCCIAVDGDGDRIAMLDKEAAYYDANHIALMLIHYLAGYRQQTGKVLVSFSTTAAIEKLCKHYGLEVIRTHVGFKESSRIMTEDQILLAAEESGGISIGDNIPERDALRAGLTIWQWMAESNKSFKDLFNEVLGITGSFAYERANIELNRNARNKIIEKCSNGTYSHFGRFSVERFEVFDGFKFFFSESEWLMIRSSGTEPLIRLYAEAQNEETAQEIIFSGMKAVME
jgi:phosphomannomutase